MIALALEAIKPIERVLETPRAACQLKAFGESSINFVLRFWIRDPVAGLGNVRSQVLLALWETFKREGIEIPFPRRDLNVRGPVRVELSEKSA